MPRCARLADAQTSPTAEGTPYVTADVASIQCTVTVGGTETWTGSISPSTAMFDTLQGWGRDDVGYNFRHTLPAEALPSGDALGVASYVFVLADGYTFAVEFVGPVGAIP